MFSRCYEDVDMMDRRYKCFLDVMKMSIRWVEKRTDIWIAYRFVDKMGTNHRDFLRTQCLLNGIKGTAYRGTEETLCTSHNTTSLTY